MANNPALAQVVTWTALPQGYVPGSTKKLRLSVFVSPQLSYFETVGLRTSTSGTLSSFPDWVDWPKTIANVAFDVTFGTTTVGPVSPLAGSLNSSLWTAAFPAATTRVDTVSGQADTSHFSSLFDTTPPKVTSFSAFDIHSQVATTYAATSAATSTGAAAAVVLQGGQIVPGATLPQSSRRKTKRQGPDVTTNSLVEAGFYTVQNALSTSNPTPPVPLAANGVAVDAVGFHRTLATLAPLPTNEAGQTLPPPAAEPPVLDFHAGLASLASYPELLPAFGLVFTLEVPAPAGISGATTVTVAPTASSWIPQLVGTTNNVALPTQCNLTSSVFQAQAFGNDYTTVGSGSILDFGTTNLSTNSTFAFSDLDFDAAAEAVSTYSYAIQSVIETPGGTGEITLEVNLPALRSSGVNLLWTGWGSPLTSPLPPSPTDMSMTLNALVSRQATIQTSVANWVQAQNSHQTLPALTPLYLEDLTRGWRLDVAVTNVDGDALGPWQSLHWRQGTYTFGPSGSVTLNLAGPTEGFVTPGATAPPTPSGNLPEYLLVHESVMRWDGWSLSAPPVFNQINDDGTTSSPAGNPVPTATDPAGNVSTQVSAQFTNPVAGLSCTDQVFPTSVIGTTGLPVLRFGNNYGFRARAVDLAGWSIPVTTSSPVTPINVLEPTLQSATAFQHVRWEPIGSPLVIPTAPLTPGEGNLTVVIRTIDGTSGTTNARWLFPPKVHEQFAELHGVFDTPEGVPDPSKYATISAYNDGSITSLPGVVMDTGTSGVANLTLPLQAGAEPPAIPINWIPDPASAGIAIAADGGFANEPFSITSVLPSNVTLPEALLEGPVFVDLWEPTTGGAWPALTGKLLQVVPGAPDQIPGGVSDQPNLEVTPATATTAEILTLAVAPASVTTLALSSIVGPNPRAAFGLTPILTATSSPWAASIALDELEASLYTGQNAQVSSVTSLTVVYAQLLPSGSFTFGQPVFGRELNSTSVTIVDPNFDAGVNTKRVSFAAIWADLVDDPSNPDNNPGATPPPTAHLAQTVVSAWPGTVLPVSPLIPEVTPPAGSASASDGNIISGGMVQVIGDTKHHYITYTPTASGYFGEFFAETTTGVVIEGTAPVVLNPSGVDANLVNVVLPASSLGNAVTVPGSLYQVDGLTGELSLVSAEAAVSQGGTQVTLSGTPLDVTWVPTNTVTGPSAAYHIPSSSTPPPVKVVKVAPAWSISTTGTTPARGIDYTRTGNTLRVYLDRPWYTTGDGELLGVVTAATGTGITDAIPTNIDPDLTTLLGFDPINVSSHSSGPDYTQTQLSFITNTAVPASGSPYTTGGPTEFDSYYTQSGSPVGGPAVAFPTAADPTATLYQIWGYQPYFDADGTGLWYADVQLNFGSGPQPPPGYFVRLALVRFQPYSLSGPPVPAAEPTEPTAYPQACFVSPTTLVTFAQPVPDRSVTIIEHKAAASKGQPVAAGNNVTLTVTVTGPGYYGWRPYPKGDVDVNNPYALHPNSGGGGNLATSTMLVEVQSSGEEAPFTGDFGWKTVATYRLTASFADPPGVTWTSSAISVNKSLTQRLRISEVDYYPYTSSTSVPSAINTSLRRPFVAHIPL